MNQCDPANQIPSYAPSTGGGGGGIISCDVKKIECVSLETDLLDVGSLKVGGVELSSLTFTTALTSTQNQTSAASIYAPRITSFSGILNIPNLSVTNIGACSIAGNLTINTAFTSSNTLSVTPTTASSSILMTAYQPSLNASNAVSLFLGAENTTNNGSTFTFNYTGSGSTSNSIVLKVVGGTSQVALTGTTTTISGPLSVGSRILGSQDTSAVYNFANNQTSSALSWATLPSVNRVIVNISKLIRATPTSTLAVMQFGYNNNWITSVPQNYVGTTMSFQGTPSAQSSNWTSNGVVLTANWITSGTSLYYSGKLILTYMGKPGNVDVWTIYGAICCPITTSGYGPYNIKYCGHFYGSQTYPSVNMIRFTTLGAGENFTSGSISISTE